MEEQQEYSTLSKITDLAYIGSGVLSTGIGLSNGMPTVTAGGAILAGNSAHNLVKKKLNQIKLKKEDYLITGLGLGLIAAVPTYYCYISQTITNPLIKVASGGLALLSATYITYPFDKKDNKTLDNKVD